MPTRALPLVLAIVFATAGAVRAEPAAPAPDQPAAPAAPLVRFATPAGSGWIDFELYEGRQIRLPVSVAGHATTAILDNGAPGSVLDLGFAATLGVSGEAPASGVAFDVGDMRVGDVSAVVADLAPASALVGKPITVVLGAEAFKEAVVDVDFAAHRVRFLPTAGFTPPPEAIDLPLSAAGAPLIVEGGSPAVFQVDLGDADAIDLFPYFIAQRRLAHGRTVAPALKFGIEGPEVDGAAMLADIALGPARFSAVPADLQARPQPGLDTTIAGRIGIGLLSRFHVILDYPQGHLYLIPRADLAGAPFDKDRVGLGLLPDNGALVVKLVAPGSPALAAGFHENDRITAIDGEPAAAWNQLRLQQAFAAAAGTRLRVTLATGATRELTLADYF